MELEKLQKGHLQIQVFLANFSLRKFRRAVLAISKTSERVRSIGASVIAERLKVFEIPA